MIEKESFSLTCIFITTILYYMFMKRKLNSLLSKYTTSICLLYLTKHLVRPFFFFLYIHV